MAGRHKLTPAERKRGTLKAIRSSKTPARLRRALRKYAKRKRWL